MKTKDGELRFGARERAGGGLGFRGSFGDYLKGGLGRTGAMGVNGRGVLNTEFAESAEDRSSGESAKMGLGKHGRG
jgi:hypothetical protein